MDASCERCARACKTIDSSIASSSIQTGVTGTFIYICSKKHCNRSDLYEDSAIKTHHAAAKRLLQFKHKNFLSKDLSIQIYNITSLTYMGQFLLITSSVQGNSFRVACSDLISGAEAFVAVVRYLVMYQTRKTVFGQISKH